MCVCIKKRKRRKKRFKLRKEVSRKLSKINPTNETSFFSSSYRIISSCYALNHYDRTYVYILREKKIKKKKKKKKRVKCDLFKQNGWRDG